MMIFVCLDDRASFKAGWPLNYKGQTRSVKLNLQAIDNPVGVGREEPNKDPYLPEVSENRSYIATSALGTGFFDASNKVIAAFVVFYVVMVIL